MRLLEALDSLGMGIVGVWNRSEPASWLVSAPLEGAREHLRGPSATMKQAEAVARLLDALRSAISVDAESKKRRSSKKLSVSPDTLNPEDDFVRRRAFMSEVAALVLRPSPPFGAKWHGEEAGPTSLLADLSSCELKDVFTAPDGCGLGSWLRGIASIVAQIAKHKQGNPGDRLIAILEADTSEYGVPLERGDLAGFYVAADIYNGSWLRHVTTLELVPGTLHMLQIIRYGNEAGARDVEFSSTERTEPTRVGEVSQ